MDDDVTEQEYIETKREVREYLSKIQDVSPLSKLPSELHRRSVITNSEEVYTKACSIEPFITRDLSTLIENGLSEFKSLEHRIKERKSLIRKIIADSKKREYGGSYLRAANKIFDSVRYTIVIKPDDLYITKVDEYLHKLEELGYYIYDLKNNWGKEYYQGLNVRIETKDGDIFELQFHTEFGYYIKEGETRDLYEVARQESDDPETTLLKQKANRLRRFLQKKVPIPIGSREYEFLSRKEKANERKK